MACGSQGYHSLAAAAAVDNRRVSMPLVIRTEPSCRVVAALPR